MAVGKGPCSPGLGMVSWAAYLTNCPCRQTEALRPDVCGCPPKSACQTGVSSLPTVLEWKETMYGPTNSLISNKEGKLKVEEAGLYYIYSQVSFCTRESLAPFTIYIYLHIPKEEDRLLLKGQKTQSTLKSLCELQSIRVGGVFNLREDDMVFVNVTDSTKVKYSHGNTYFGIFKL